MMNCVYVVYSAFIDCAILRLNVRGFRDIFSCTAGNTIFTTFVKMINLMFPYHSFLSPTFYDTGFVCSITVLSIHFGSPLKFWTHTDSTINL